MYSKWLMGSQELSRHFIRWNLLTHDDVIKWKHFPCYWPFVRGIHRPQVNSPHKGQWRGALMFSLVCAMNKGLSKQPWRWWVETPSRSLWRHCNDTETFSRDPTIYDVESTLTKYQMQMMFTSNCLRPNYKLGSILWRRRPLWYGINRVIWDIWWYRWLVNQWNNRKQFSGRVEALHWRHMGIRTS